MKTCGLTPEHVVASWFTCGDAPSVQEHGRLWNRRLRGGAHHELAARVSAHISPAAAGELNLGRKTRCGGLR